MMQKMGAPGAQAAPSPSASPMSTPQPAAGMKEQALVQVRLATKILEKSLPAFGYETEEGKAILDILQKCAKAFGKTEDKQDELMPAELKQVMQSIAGGPKPPSGAQGAGGPPPAQPMPAM
jgi:hypothetical protein